MRILAVDDDADALRYLTGVLGENHEVTACSTGEEAQHQMRLQLDEAHALTFGYVPRGNSARLLGVGVPLLLGHAPGDSNFQRLITSGAAKVFGSFGWTSRAYLTGIEDRYLIALQPSIIERLKPTFTTAKGDSQIQRVLPNDVYSVSSYRFAEPAAAWQSLKTSVSSQVDVLSAIVFSSVLKSALLSYGIDDADAFLGGADGELLTLQLDETDERAILIAGVRDRARLRELVTGKFGMRRLNEPAGESETFKDGQGEFMASFIDDFIVIGAAADVRRYVEGRRANAAILTTEKLRRMTSYVSSPDSASIVTYTDDSDRVRSFLSAMIVAIGAQTPPGHLDEVLSGLPYSVTETTLGDRGIERSTRSPLGQFSTLLPLLIPERLAPTKKATESK